MNEIQDFTIRVLPSGTFYTYLRNVLDAAKADTAVMEHCGKWVTPLDAAFAELDAAMFKTLGSELSKQIEDADDKRDNAYRQLRDMTKVMASFPVEATREAAARVQKCINTYRVDIYAQRDRETGMLTNFLQELTGVLAADIAQMGLTPVVEELERNNNLVYELTQNRSYDDSVKSHGELTEARKKCNAAYIALHKAVNAYAYYFETDVLDRFILFVNDNITRLKRQALKQKTAKPSTADGSNAATDGNAEDTGSNDDDTDENSDGGDNTDNTNPSGTTTPPGNVPTNPQPGNEDAPDL